MDVQTFASGVLIDEVVLRNGDLELRRTGAARYLAVFEEGRASVEVELWTTKAARVRVQGWPDRPAWARVRTDGDAILEDIAVTGVGVHVEHLERGAYFVGFTRGDDRWGLALVTYGYIKTRLRPGSVAPHGSTLRRSEARWTTSS